MAFNFLDDVLPVGASNLKLLYNFDGSLEAYPPTQPANTLQDLSGNTVNLTLNNYGYPVYIEPFSVTAQGESVLMSLHNRYLHSVTTHSGVFNTLGEITVEWIGYSHVCDIDYERWLCCSDCSCMIRIVPISLGSTHSTNTVLV